MKFSNVAQTATVAFAILSTAGAAELRAQSPALPAIATPIPAHSTSTILMIPATDFAPLATPYLVAENAENTGMPTASSSSSSTALPEDPGTLLQQQSTDSTTFKKADQTTAKSSMVVPTGFPVEPLNVGDKVKLTLVDTFSLQSLLGIFLSAGYSDVTNGQPNYGTNPRAFGQRLGAAAARDSSEELFSDAIFAPILHQDPRYFREGSSHNFVHRALYAATRTLITRTDGGHETINASLLLGYAGGTALTQAYYPQVNRNFNDAAASYGGSIGGQALYYLYSEFFNSGKDFFRLRVAQ